MPDAETWTVGRLLGWTTDYLSRHHSDTPRLDSEVLLGESLGCERIELYTRFDEAPDETVRTAFRELVRRRAEGTPVAYLVGHREFYSLAFRVTPDVLIPRPETEFLVIAALDLAKAFHQSDEIAVCDVGTGSGVIAVCLARHLPNCRVTAVDISPEALAVARFNVAKHDVADRIELLESDLLKSVPSDRRFDLILSNPPYVSQAEFDTLAPDVREYEPRDALIAGVSGTEVIEALLPQAAERLRPGGHLLVEISPMIHEAVCRLIDADTRFQLGQTVTDLARLPRATVATRV
jgi:release factor glutamine methyltransferase